MIRTVLAVVAAPIVWGVVMFPGNLILLALFPGAETVPTTSYLLAALFGSVAYSLITGVVTVLISGGRPLQHGLWGGVAVLAVGVFVQIQYWDTLPLWYHLSFLVLLVPGCIAGALLFGNRRSAR
jgi:hypothetical protein